MSKKDFLFLMIMYLPTGLICSVLNHQSFITAFSTYNIFQQQEELKYYEYGTILITKPNLTNSEKMEYKTLKVIADATIFLKYVNSESTVVSLIATGFGYSLPFVLLLWFLINKSRAMKIVAAIGFIYLFYSITISNERDNAENNILRYFEEMRAIEQRK